MKRPWTLATRMGAIGGALLLLALAAVGLTLWMTWQLEGGAAAVNDAGRLRMQAWRLAQTLPGGDAARVDRLVREFDERLALLRAGDPSRPLFVPRDPRSQAAFAEVQRRWEALRAAWTMPSAPPSDVAAAQAEGFVEGIDAFVSAIELQLSRWTAVLNLVQLVMVALTLVSAVSLIYAASMFIFDPLARLRRGLERVQAGDLSARVDVATRDEFGALAAGFNDMAQTLQALYEGLEAQVREKTLGLETERQRLSALYEAAALVARAGSLDELARGFAQQLRRVARADASAIRWSDEHNRRYLLLASDCLPLEMLDREHCVATGDCLCGQPRAQAALRVIPIRSDAGPTTQGHCERAGYETLVSVPVALNDRLVGEIDLFYRHAVVLADDDRVLLQALASHLAGAMESLRAGALEREAVIAEERGLLARELHDSIAQSLSFLKIQVGLLREALRRGDTPQVESVLGELDAGVRESVSDVRELLVHFRTRTNGEDIEPALQTTLRKFEHQTGLRTELSIAGDGLPLAPDVQVQVLHVVQEALSNVRKHARASTVWVDVQRAPWRVEVRDDGTGFDPAQSAGETHVGLHILHERARGIGARVELHSGRGEGTRVVLTLPERVAGAERAAA